MRAEESAQPRLLRAARERLGYTELQVAKLLGCSLRTVERMERGLLGSSRDGRERLKRYLGWLYEEAEVQAEARKLRWIEEFGAQKLCPEEELLWT